MVDLQLLEKVCEISLVNLVLLVFASWRLTCIIYEDKIAERFRELFGEKVHDGLASYPDTFLGNLISCFRCVSVWTSFFITVLYLIHPVLILPFSISGLIIILNNWLNNHGYS